MAFNSTGDSIALREGDRFSSIACVADCKPSCTFRWTKGQTSVSTSAVLDLGVVSRDDQGEYTCTATHSVYTVFTDTKPYPITVIYGPDTVSLSPPSTIYTKSEHDPLGEIFCSAVCTPECAYTWSKDDTSETLRNNAILNLGQLSRQEAGSYICTATNPSSSATRNGSTVVVEVISSKIRDGPDAVTLNVPSVYSVSEEATVSNIECSADCWPGCVFTWTNVTGSQLISSSNVLVFGRADRYDAGDYSCLAKNSANQLSGEAEKHFTLRVQ
ncbi:HMCN1-like protein, partial [Mya arenaria]